MNSSMQSLLERVYELNALNVSERVLQWDQEVNLAQGSMQSRAEHLGILSKLHHELLVSESTTQLVKEAKKDTEEGTDEAALIRVLERSIDKATKLPTKLVTESAKAKAEGQDKWVQARAKNDFKSFEPYLKRIFDLAREEAECYGYKGHIYDALHDNYEEDSTYADCKELFDTIKQPVVDLCKKIRESNVEIDSSILLGDWDKQKLSDFIKQTVKEVGYDFDRGRMDDWRYLICLSQRSWI